MKIAFRTLLSLTILKILSHLLTDLAIEDNVEYMSKLQHKSNTILI